MDSDKWSYTAWFQTAESKHLSYPKEKSNESAELKWSLQEVFWDSMEWKKFW